jgi:hypothetical protein
MKKILLLSMFAVLMGSTIMAQKVSTKVIDNKGTIKWVLDSSTAVITKADSTILYVTPTQLHDSLNNYVKYADTANMLSTYINGAANGLTKNGQNLELGGALSRSTTIATTASNFLAITGLQRGSNTTDSLMVVDPSTGQVKFISATSLFNSLTFSNGLTKTGNSVKLGGNLTEPTTIGTDATNNLKITGLQSGNLATDSLVVSASDGTLKRVTAESLLQSGDQSFDASAGQQDYVVTNMPAKVSKVWVFRNGAKLIAGTDYTTVAGTCSFSNAMAALVVSGDMIEVQWVK